MTALALGLVLLSALLHATWNLLAKRAGGGPPFVALFSLLTTLLLAPPALWLAAREGFPSPLGWGFVAGSAVLHLLYFLALQRGYRRGDLSLVYPVARGSGPLLATAAAVLLLGERPSGQALAGALLIVAGGFVLGGGARGAGARPALAWGLLTGVFIAGYTVLDAAAVTRLGLPPLLYLWLAEVGRTLLLAPVALRRRGEVRQLWRERRGAALGVALLSPLAYLLVLFAMRLAPVSYVAPAREVSILLGALLGARLLAEGQGRRRLLAAAGVALGVALLALG